MKKFISLLASATILALLQSCSIISPITHNVVSVSFASECCGTNSEGISALSRFLEQDKKLRGFAISYTETRWGREGEFTRCFPLVELPPAEKQIFISSLRQKLEGYKLVSVTEEATCPRQ